MNGWSWSSVPFCPCLCRVCEDDCYSGVPFLAAVVREKGSDSYNSIKAAAGR